LLFTGRQEDANDIAFCMKSTLKVKVGYKVPGNNAIANSFDEIRVGIGYLKNSNISTNENKNIRDTGIYAENTFQGDTYVSSIYIQNKICNRLTLYNNFSVFRINSTGLSQSVISDKTQSYSDISYQYNLGVSFMQKKGYSLGAVVGFYKENSTSMTATYDSLKGEFNYLDYGYSHNAQSGTFFLGKRISKFEILVSYSVGNLSDNSQSQFTGGIVCYPFGSTTFYIMGSYSYLHNGSAKQNILLSSFGGKISNTLWYELFGSYGDHTNYISSTGFVSYNTVDPILYNVNGKINFCINKHFAIIPSYTMQQREDTYEVWLTQSSQQLVKHRYINNLFSISVKWKI
jgi:hypothetical protein